ncbi:MAG: hypothetical protein CHACPFDD_02422 [Phycisphaerae bacterium]|nr:hypothetical protein [Phycisphaerae bacterium]
MTRAALPQTGRDCAVPPRGAAQLALACGAAFVVLLAVLHLLKPELDPSRRFISEYELGDFGWVMRAAFVALALSCISLGAALLAHVRTIAGYLGLLMLAASAAGMVLAAIFECDSLTAADPTPTGRGRLHELGAMLDMIPLAALLINWSLSRSPAWRVYRPGLFWSAWIPLAGTVVFVWAMMSVLPAAGGRPGPETRLGWPNRIMILSHAAWLMLIAGWAAGARRSRRMPDAR